MYTLVLFFLVCFLKFEKESEEESGVEIGTTYLENFMATNNNIQQTIDNIIESQHILSGNKAIFDDITMLGIEFYENKM